MQESKRVYISGPITGTTNADIRFQAAADIIREMGNIPVNPTFIDKALPNGTYAEFMTIDIILLYACDAIYMLRGWRESNGARIEYQLAEIWGKEIIYEELSES